MATAILTATARGDLLEIWLYIATENERAADRVLARLDDAIQTLASHPEMGRLRPELAGGLRSFVAGPYAVYYRATSDGIEVARVLHTSRDIDPIGW